MAEVSRSGAVMADILADSKPLRDLAAQDPTVLKALSKGLTTYLPTPAYVNNAHIYIIVVVSLGLVILATMVGAIVLASQKLPIPETITALGSAAIGAVAGLLAPSPGKA